MKEPVKFFSYKSEVFRNIAGLAQSKDLMKDIISTDNEQEILKKYYYPDPQTSTDKPAIERVMNRSIVDFIQSHISAKFKPGNWYKSRFSDGTFGVLYTAEDEKTALIEALYHARNNIYKEELKKKKSIKVDRKVIALEVESKKAIDLEKQSKYPEKLVSKTKSGYPYCQKLARKAINMGTEHFKTPSARKKGGICIPIFEKNIAWDKGYLKTLICELSNTKVKVYTPEFEFSFD